MIDRVRVVDVEVGVVSAQVIVERILQDVYDSCRERGCMCIEETYGHIVNLVVRLLVFAPAEIRGRRHIHQLPAELHRIGCRAIELRHFLVPIVVREIAWRDNVPIDVQPAAPLALVAVVEPHLGVTVVTRLLPVICVLIVLDHTAAVLNRNSRGHQPVVPAVPPGSRSGVSSFRSSAPCPR